MALETGTYISDLVASNPAAADGLVDADNHFRLIKNVVKATFPNITGAVTPTHTELNFVDGVTSAIQTQLDAHTTALALKAPLASPTFTGTPAAPTAAPGTNTTQVSTTAFVTAAVAALSVADDSITNAKLAEVATATFKGRATAGTGNPEDLTATQATALLNVASASTKGLVPAPSASPVSTKYLAEDMTYVSLSSGITQMATQTPVSGTTVDFTGIPSTAKKVSMLLSGISLNGTNILQFGIGDSGGIETTGYTGLRSELDTASTATAAAGSPIDLAAASTAATTYSGIIECTLLDAATFTWVINFSLQVNGATNRQAQGIVVKSLSAALDRVQIKASASSTFDAGIVSVQYQ